MHVLLGTETSSGVGDMSKHKTWVSSGGGGGGGGSDLIVYFVLLFWVILVLTTLSSKTAEYDLIRYR